jgi:predicted phosphodiesterase
VAEQQVDVVSQLGDLITEKLAANAKKTTPIPEVYSSGMRGNEKPPHLREQKKNDKKVDSKKKVVDDDGQEVDPKTGKRIVKFAARERTSLKDENAALKKEIAALKAKKKRVSIV